MTGNGKDARNYRKIERSNMGYLQERHGIMMLGRVPDGTCPLCAVSHDRDSPITGIA